MTDDERIAYQRYPCAKCSNSAYRFGQPYRVPPPFLSLNAAHLEMMCELCWWLMVDMCWRFVGYIMPLPDWWGPQMQARFIEARDHPELLHRQIDPKV